MSESDRCLSAQMTRILSTGLREIFPSILSLGDLRLFLKMLVFYRAYYRVLQINTTQEIAVFLFGFIVEA